MEQWEKELREKLEKEIPDGMYRIGIEPLYALTGKQWQIDYEVILAKMSKKLNEEAIKSWGPGILKQIEKPFIPLGKGIENQMSSPPLSEATEQDIIDLMNQIRKNCKP